MSEKIIASADLAEALSYWATAFGIVLALAGGAYVMVNTQQERKLNRWSQARDLYSQYLIESKNHPEFFESYWLRADLSAHGRWEYRQFISFMVWAIEEILINDKLPQWRITLITDLRPHVDYLRSSEFHEELTSYFRPVQELIFQVIEQYPEGGTHA